MTPNMMLLFFITDYYKVVDVRMMKFFTEMSQLTLWVPAGLVALSFLYKNFWCRYLCPYGALLGLLSKLSQIKVRRNDKKCVHCGACTRSCFMLVGVDKEVAVSSAECFSCLTCVSHCPSEGAPDVSITKGSKVRTFRPLFYPALLVALFYLVIGIGTAAGKWKSQVPYERSTRG